MMDTSIEILEKQREIIYSKSFDERFIIGVDAINFGRKMVEESIMQRNPEISAIGLKIEVFKRCYGNVYEPSEIDKITDAMRKWDDRINTSDLLD
jgi:hypothetical protein